MAGPAKHVHAKCVCVWRHEQPCALHAKTSYKSSHAAALLHAKETPQRDTSHGQTCTYRTAERLATTRIAPGLTRCGKSWPSRRPALPGST